MKSNIKALKASAFVNKKFSAVTITVIMILSVLTILALGSPSANAAPVGVSNGQTSFTAAGSVSYTPDVFSSGSTTLVSFNGGVFGAGSTVYFYVSDTASSAGITQSYIGFVSLSTASTSLNYLQAEFHIPSVTAGTYYLLASDSSSYASTTAQFTSASQITITSLGPSLSVAGTQPTTKGTIGGSGWDPSSTVDVYLAGAAGAPLYSTLLSAVTVTSSGSVASGTTYTVPEVADGSYNIVAVESSSSTNSGITADAAISVSPVLVVSPVDISGIIGSQFTVSGYGFPSLSSIPTNAISVGSTIETSTSTTASTSGTFSVGVSLAAAITSTGYYSVTARYNSSSYTQSNAILVSIPNEISLGFSFTPTTVYTGQPFTATVWNFPSDSQVSITLGPDTLGQFTTDSNGYGQVTGNVPALPLTSNSYYVRAQSSGFVESIAVSVSSYFQVVDPSGVLMVSTSEYFPSTGHYIVQAFGLNPTSVYTFSDSAKSSSYQVGSVSSGTLVSESALEFTPSENGTLIFTFFPEFASSATTSTITLSSSAGSFSGYSGETFGYTAVQSPSFGIAAAAVLDSSASETLTITGIVPTGKQVYPGLSTSYNLYAGTTELSFTIGSSSQSTTTLSYTSSTVSIGFIAPSTSGLYYLNLTYSGQSYSSPVKSIPVVVSSPSLSLNSGTVVSVPVKSGGVVTGYDVVGYSFYQPATVTLYYYTGTALESAAVGLSYGGFSYTGLSFSSDPSSTYEIIAHASYSGSTYTADTTYSVYPSFTATASGLYSSPIGTSVTFTLTSFSANTYYNVTFGTVKVATVQTTYSGSATGTFNIPAALPGKYNITVVDASSLATAASEQFNVTSNAYVSLSTKSNYAFPGQLVQFIIKDVSPGTLPIGMTAVAGTASYSVVISLNGTSFETVPATYSSAGSGYVNGSFQMPNNATGSYYIATFTPSETVLASYVPTSGQTGYETVTVAFSGSQSDYLGLVSGNGAYILGVSQSQIAEIDSSINATLSVPLSQLNAAISSIDGDIVTITTEFGTMTASLNSINATIDSINLGVVSLGTTLGQVKTSLASLNSTVVALNNDTATISTDVGVYKTTLNNINATVAINKDNIATIQTDLGTFTGNVTSVSNGIATIQTALGTIKTNTNQVVPSYGTSFLLEIIILVLVVIAVVFSALAMKNTRRKF